MNYRLLARMLGAIAWLIGGTMVFSLPWAFPALRQASEFEHDGFRALVASIVICLVVGGLLRHIGRGAGGTIYRKEAMAVVGLSWVLATALGALPFLLSGTSRGLDAKGQPIPMSIPDCLFESQSGFSTTGATVLNDLENEDLVPRCILFWRSGTHFLGGLGIIVLFVAVLGQGSAGKALMRAEIPGPSKDGAQARMQHAAWTFAGIYCVLVAVLAVLLRIENMNWFDAICHSFGTMATGGFSTYNASIAHFANNPQYDGVMIEMTIIIFMIIAGTNFTLLYFVLLRRPKRLLGDIEWRTYIAVMAIVTVLIIAFGLQYRDFSTWRGGLRYGLFQVVSIMTTTGYGTHNFDAWNSFGRGVLFLLMFVGGCAGSTGGGMKVIRHILFLKIMGQEVEHSFHPTVVRPLRLGGEAIADTDLRHSILVYFGLILVIFVFSWMVLVTWEPDSTWSSNTLQNKLIDSASGIAATLNNIGPGLGTVGATENYANFSPQSKLLFTWLMMVGRLEIFVILVLFVPSFWRNR